MNKILRNNVSVKYSLGSHVFIPEKALEFVVCNIVQIVDPGKMINYRNTNIDWSL